MKIALFLLVTATAVAQTLQAPVDGYPSSGVGQRPALGPNAGGDERFHKGVDLSVPIGTPVVPAARGTVVEHWPPPDGYYKGHPTFGGYLIVYHGRGIYSAYAHLSQTFVNTGQWVDREDVIALSGATGVTTGPHLHFVAQLQKGAAQRATHIASSEHSDLNLIRLLI